MDKEKETFVEQLAAFCTLMQHGDGIISKSPEYIWEKFTLATSLPPQFLYQLYHGSAGADFETWKERWLKKSD